MCANVIQKTHKYVKLGELGLKFHKVGQGLFGLATCALDIGEFLATDAAEWGRGKEYVETVQSYLPNFHGNLPENWNYYAGKDLAVISGCALFGANPIMLCLGAFQGGFMAYKFYNEKYTDDVLTSIMINLRYFSKQPPTKETNESREKSMNNLIYYLENNHKISDSEDSKVKQRAKVIAFEYKLSKLKEKNDWDAIIAETDLTFSAAACCKYSKANIEVFDAISAVNKRYEAFTTKMKDVDSFEITRIPKLLEEVTKLLSYVNCSFQKLPSAQKKSMQEYVDDVKFSFESIKICLLKNFLVLYTKGQRTVTPWAALNIFDSIPMDERGIQEWFSLGGICNEFYTENRLAEILELKLFCFETVYTIIEVAEQNGATLTDFTIELKEKSKRVIDELKGGLSGNREYSLDTLCFTPVIEKIIEDSRQKGKEELY